MKKNKCEDCFHYSWNNLNGGGNEDFCDKQARFVWDEKGKKRIEYEKNWREMNKDGDCRHFKKRGSGYIKSSDQLSKKND